MSSPDSSDTVTASSVCLAPVNLHAGLEGDLAPAERPLQQLGGELVLVGHQPRQRLDDRDLRAEALEHRRELHADHPAAEDTIRSRHRVEPDGLVAGDDPAADLEAGQGAGVAAGGQHDLLADVPRRRPTSTAFGADERPVAGHEVDLAALHQPLQALVELGDDAVLVAVHPGHVDAGQRALDADLVALAGGVGHLGGVQQRLGRDAALVQAGAAQLVASRPAPPTSPARRRAARRRTRPTRRRGSPGPRCARARRHLPRVSPSPRLTAARVVAAHPVTSATSDGRAVSPGENRPSRTLFPTASPVRTKEAAWDCGRGCAGATGQGRCAVRPRTTRRTCARGRPRTRASRRSSSRGRRSRTTRSCWSRRTASGPGGGSAGPDGGAEAGAVDADAGVRRADRRLPAADARPRRPPADPARPRAPPRPGA